MIRMEAKQAKQFSLWMEEIEAAIVAGGIEQMVAECRLGEFGQTNLQEQFLAGATPEQMAEIIPPVRGE